MISTLCLKFGRVPGAKPTAITVSPVTVFVGPNNSGKSKLLREISHFCAAGYTAETNVALDHLTFHGRRPEELNALIDYLTLPPNPGDALQLDHILVGKQGGRSQVPRLQFKMALENPASNLQGFCQWYVGYNTLMLDGHSRMGLTNAQPAGDLRLPPHTSLQVLFRDDAKRAEVRRIVHDAFGIYLVVDPTNLGFLRLALSEQEPANAIVERGIHREALAFHSQSLPIEQASDGVKAFTGMICEITAGDPHVVLIDEPEAFLHPALSFKLGKEIAVASTKNDKRLFVSTHSPNFVMGCIQSGAPVNIIRLTYREKVATARVLRNEDILRLMRNPLLRSTGVIGALFYECVVIIESDADRAFYHEINERLLRFNPQMGVANCLFLNAQNKQTVQTILEPLRELGIPAAAIVDIDVVKDGGQTWTSFLEAGHIPALEHQSLAAIRNAVKQKLEATCRNMKRDGGIDLLTGTDREGAANLVEKLSEYGLFVVKKGELESWLKPLNATGHGPPWLIDVFERMGEDPDAQGYVKPADDDVWAFMCEVKDWLTNPRRKGIPA